jgi:TRAP-type C4-dicarboxylate transport system permease small subunit
LVTAQVVFRYFFSNPLPWPEELGRLSFIFLVFIGGALASIHDEHISIEAIDSLLKRKKKALRIVKILREFLVVLIMVITVVGGIEIFPRAHRIALSATGFPKSLMTLAVIIGGLLIGAESVRRIILQIINYSNDDSDQLEDPEAV